jgi:solute:Na+ symporter, SSS family
LIIIIPGLVAPQLLPKLEKPDMVFPTLVKNLLPTGLVGLVMAGLIAAIMSHISGTINSCTTIATMDFYLPYIKKDATEKQAVRFGKIIGVIIIVLGILWATALFSYSDKPIFVYLLNAYGYVTPGIAAMFLLGIFWKRATNAGALAAGAVTIPLSIIMEQTVRYLPDYISVYVKPFMNRTGIVFWVCILAGIVVSLMTKPKSEDQLKGLIWNIQSLSMPNNLRAKMRGLRSPFLWWAVVTAAVIFMYVRFR